MGNRAVIAIVVVYEETRVSNRLWFARTALLQQTCVSNRTVVAL